MAIQHPRRLPHQEIYSPRELGKIFRPIGQALHGLFNGIEKTTKHVKKHVKAYTAIGLIVGGGAASAIAPRALDAYQSRFPVAVSAPSGPGFGPKPPSIPLGPSDEITDTVGISNTTPLTGTLPVATGNGTDGGNNRKPPDPDGQNIVVTDIDTSTIQIKVDPAVHPTKVDGPPKNQYTAEIAQMNSVFNANNQVRRLVADPGYKHEGVITTRETGFTIDNSGGNDTYRTVSGVFTASEKPFGLVINTETDLSRNFLNPKSLQVPYASPAVVIETGNFNNKGSNKGIFVAPFYRDGAYKVRLNLYMYDPPRISMFQGFDIKLGDFLPRLYARFSEGGQIFDLINLETGDSISKINLATYNAGFRFEIFTNGFFSPENKFRAAIIVPKEYQMRIEDVRLLMSK